MPAASCGGTIAPQPAALRELQREHALWNCRLLAGFAQGASPRDDLRSIFSQYHLYTSGFTRFLLGVDDVARIDGAVIGDPTDYRMRVDVAGRRRRQPA